MTHTHTHSHNHNHAHHHQGDYGLKAFMAPAISFVMLVAGILMNYFRVSFFIENNYVELTWYLLSFFSVGLPVIKESIEGMMSKDYFSEFTLMTIACIGAFCIGEYPEAVGVMLFYSIGETLQDKAVDKATRNISALLDVRSERATVLRNGVLQSVAPATVAVGEIIEIRPGERVPLDGILESSHASFDTSALTGESMPRELVRGEEVLAGMISSATTVRIKVNKEYGQSTLSRILELVKDASDRKAHAELFIHKFARIYTPVVMLLACMVVLVPWVYGSFAPAFHYDFSEWLYRALVFLVISCPCALVISVPLGYFAGIGAASRAGVLFKGGNYLDAITRVNTVAFDKTGTLTTGRFSVVKTVVTSLPEEELLAMMASAEQDSSHPLAKALVEYVKASNISIPVAGNIHEHAGYGITAEVNGSRVVVGNLRHLAQEKIAVPTGIKADGGTLIASGIDGSFGGYVILEDTVRPESVRAIADLKGLGIKSVVMLSGDKQEIVDRYARELDISEAHGELLPADKAAYIEGLTKMAATKVAFVGDGMNDAPVLAMSDVGIAMGGLGSDAAIESAGVVIQTDNPAKVATAIKLGRKTRVIVMENIVGAIAMKVTVLVLGVLGVATLWGAVFADVGVAMLAVLNSLRIFGGKK